MFIATPTVARLSLSQDTRWLGVVILLASSGGGMLLLNTKVVTCTFDKSTNQATIAECQQTLHQTPDDVEAYQRLAIALSSQGQKDQAKHLLESGRSRFQSYGEFEKAAHLDYVLTLLKLKAKTHWWEAC